MNEKKGLAARVDSKRSELRIPQDLAAQLQQQQPQTLREIPVPEKHLKELYKLLDANNEAAKNGGGSVARLNLWTFIESIWPNENFREGNWDIGVVNVWNVKIVKRAPAIPEPPSA